MTDASAWPRQRRPGAQRGGGAARRVLGERVAERAEQRLAVEQLPHLGGGENERRHAANARRSRDSPCSRLSSSHACGRVERGHAALLVRPPIPKFPSPRFPDPSATLSVGALQRRSAAQGPAQGPWRDHRGHVAGRRVSRSCTRSSMRARSRSSRTCGCRTSGSRQVASRDSPFRSTSRTRGSDDSSATRSSTSKARRARSACASCGTRRGTRSSTATSCIAVASGRSCSASRRRSTRSTTGRIRRASGTCSTCVSGTRRAIRTRTSRRRSRCGSGRGRTGASRYAGWPALREASVRRYADERDLRPEAARSRRDA